MKQTLYNSWWRRRDVLLMIGGKTTSALGDAVLSVVLLLYVHNQGYGFLAVAALMACEAVPVIALMGLAGRIADSRDSRGVLLLTTLVQAVACLALITVHQTLAAILALILVIQTAQAISQATWSGLTPRVVGEENIGKVVSTQQALGAVAMPLGAALGPALLGLFGSDVAIAVDAATFAVLALAVLLIRTRRHVHPDAPPHRGLRLDLLRRDRPLWLLTLALAPVMLFLVGINVLEVFLVRDNLGVPTQWYGLTSVAWGLGAVVGAAVAGRIAKDQRRISAAVTSLFGVGICCIAMGLSPNFPIFLACSVGVGIANAVVNACYGTVLMTRTHDADRGKISATVNGIMQTASLAGLPLGGVIGDLVGTRTAIISLGTIACLLVGGTAVRLTQTRHPNQATTPSPDLADNH